VAAFHAERAGPLGGLVLLGYPLHPPRRPQQRRDAHLPAVGVPMLFVQGSRDAFGTPDELRQVLSSLPVRADLVVVDGGDHSFVVRRSRGESQDQVLTGAADRVARWIAGEARVDATGC
jgi:predicted alpha/beta-hydrolase family hydrolase